MTPTLTAFAGFAAWSLFLLGHADGGDHPGQAGPPPWAVPANGFVPDNANLSPFMQRLARAHANCVEGLPILGGLMLVAVLSHRSAVTDPLAYVFLAARILQSLIHLISVSNAAVTLRFTAFAAQMAIAVYWAARLLAA